MRARKCGESISDSELRPDAIQPELARSALATWTLADAAPNENCGDAVAKTALWRLMNRRETYTELAQVGF